MTTERYSFLSGSSMLLDIVAVGNPSASGPLPRLQAGRHFSIKTNQFDADHIQGTADCDYDG
jgi:hypothetical protein